MQEKEHTDNTTEEVALSNAETPKSFQETASNKARSPKGGPRLGHVSVLPELLLRPAASRDFNGFT